MKKILYFQTGADDVTAFPADRIYAIDAGTATIEIYFTGTGTGTLLSSVGLTVTAGQEEAALKAIVQKINEGPHSDGLIVIADDANSVYCHSGITACGTITLDTTP
jgi:TM2 domain-containing membrane protein YozV